MIGRGGRRRRGGGLVDLCRGLLCRGLLCRGLLCRGLLYSKHVRREGGLVGSAHA